MRRYISWRLSSAEPVPLSCPSIYFHVQIIAAPCLQFNARSETVTEKPIFSRLLPQQRCVVILDGFYEWKADAGGKKQPYYVSFGEGEVMRMAGLYDVWSGEWAQPTTCGRELML